MFVELKQCLFFALVLTLPDLYQPFKIEKNASHYSIGAVLTQQWYPVAYHSKTLLDTQDTPKNLRIHKIFQYVVKSGVLFSIP